MENQFIPYELALALKELGFKERCFLRYYESTFKQLDAPLWQQAFDWFREKHDLYSVCYPELDVWVIEIKELKGYEGNSCITGYPDLEYNSYEKARLACLEELIELCKEKKS